MEALGEKWLRNQSMWKLHHRPASGSTWLSGACYDTAPMAPGAVSVNRPGCHRGSIVICPSGQSIHLWVGDATCSYLTLSWSPDYDPSTPRNQTNSGPGSRLNNQKIKLTTGPPGGAGGLPPESLVGSKNPDGCRQPPLGGCRPADTPRDGSRRPLSMLQST